MDENKKNTKKKNESGSINGNKVSDRGMMLNKLTPEEERVI